MRNAALQLRRVGKSEGTVNGLKMHKYVIKYRRVVASRCVNSQGRRAALLYPTASLFVFFRNFAGIGRSSFHVIFIGLLPSCFT